MASKPLKSVDSYVDTKSQKDLIVYLGRFSPFHNGHVAVLERAMKSSKNILVLVGSAGQPRTTKNPFNYYERRDMILDWAFSEGPGNDHQTVWCMPLYDHPYNMAAWIEEVQTKVLEKKADVALQLRKPIEEVSVYLTGCDKDDTTWYLNSFGNFFKMDLVEEISHKELSATLLRQYLFEEQRIPDLDMVPASTTEFMRTFTEVNKSILDELIKEYSFIKDYKKKWEAAPFAPTFVTVDTCVIQSGHVLLNVRDNFPGKGLWALPGGFLEQHETLQDGAIRELKEETSIGLSDAQLYGSIKAKEIFDNPGRSLRGRTITTCFLLRLDDTKPLPRLKPQRGEVKKCEWVPISEALRQSDRFLEDHHAILEWALGVKT